MEEGGEARKEERLGYFVRCIWLGFFFQRAFCFNSLWLKGKFCKINICTGKKNTASTLHANFDCLSLLPYFFKLNYTWIPVILNST